MMNDNTAILSVAGSFVLNTFPYVIRFFLISLLMHLLLRGFWIGIVGLSSVSNNIDFEKLGFKGPFRKYIPSKVRSLDDLIFFIDQISSVIFAYTYLLVFSILSVAIVSSFLFMILGLVNLIPRIISDQVLMGFASMTIVLIAIIMVIGAIIFFLDTLLFSAFKKSKWFSVIYFPLYRFFSVISLSFIYRSIYYHLITNFKKKQIIIVSGVLLVMVVLSSQFSSWDRYTYFPEQQVKNQFLLNPEVYDDEREGNYIQVVSIPSKVIDSNYLPLFIRYSPKQNIAFNFYCPDFRGINEGLALKDGINAGMKSSGDTTRSLSTILDEVATQKSDMERAIQCLQSVFEVSIDGQMIVNDFVFTQHSNRDEKGFMQMLDISELDRGKHVITVKLLEFQGNLFIQDLDPEKFKMTKMAEIIFWKN
ncbi:MAG TPA: hypothetical protein VIN11_00220, partial [Roseivirga sp.]